MMKADPRIKKNGRCAVCTQKRPPAAVEAEDPFCSNACCREFHEVVFPSDNLRARYNRTAKPLPHQTPKGAIIPKPGAKRITVNAALK